MENSLLNKAHQWERKAEHYLRRKSFDESISAHQMAIQLLADIKSHNPKVSESVTLQRLHHLRQIELITLKKQHYDKYKLAAAARHQQPDEKSVVDVTLTDEDAAVKVPSEGEIVAHEDSGDEDRPPIFYLSRDNSSSDTLDEDLPALELPNFDLPALSSRILDDSD